MSVATASLDRHIDGDSHVHRAGPRVKTGATFVFIAALSSLPVGQWWFIAVFFLAVWVAAVWSGIGPLRLLKRTFIAVPFIVIAVPSAFTHGGEPLARWDLQILTLTPTWSGVEFVLTIMLRSWIAVTSAILLTATTPYLEIVSALRWFRVPSLFVAVMSMMYRYLFLLIAEAERMLTARRARSASVDGLKSGGTVRWRAKTTGNMAGSLFVRTFDRSERIYMAMVARGYSGEAKTPGTIALSTGDAVTLIVLSASIIAVAVTARLV